TVAEAGLLLDRDVDGQRAARPEFALVGDTLRAEHFEPLQPFIGPRHGIGIVFLARLQPGRVGDKSRIDGLGPGDGDPTEYGVRAGFEGNRYIDGLPVMIGNHVAPHRLGAGPRRHSAPPSARPRTRPARPARNRPTPATAPDRPDYGSAAPD